MIQIYQNRMDATNIELGRKDEMGRVLEDAAYGAQWTIERKGQPRTRLRGVRRKRHGKLSKTETLDCSKEKQLATRKGDKYMKSFIL